MRRVHGSSRPGRRTGSLSRAVRYRYHFRLWASLDHTWRMKRKPQGVLDDAGRYDCGQKLYAFLRQRPTAMRFLFCASGSRRTGPYSLRSPSPADPGKVGMPGLVPAGDNPIAQDMRRPLPGAVGPGSRRRRRRYADPPAAALLTGRGAGGWSPLRSRPYAHFAFR
jgi:hypothetical protein